MVLLDLKIDLLSLFAVCSFLLKITLSLMILNFFDLNKTFFFNKILLSSIKLPSLAVIRIFLSRLSIENLGSVISADLTEKLEIIFSSNEKKNL